MRATRMGEEMQTNEDKLADILYVDENEMYRPKCGCSIDYGTAFPFIYIKKYEEMIIIEKHQLLLFNIGVYRENIVNISINQMMKFNSSHSFN